MRFFDASWQPGQRYMVYGGTARNDCCIYRRESDQDQVGKQTDIVGPYEELDAIANALNLAINPPGWRNRVAREVD